MLIENLEGRRLFAMTVAVTGGVLTITGDDSANFIEVRGGNGTLVVRTATEEADDTTDDDDTSGGCGGHRGGPGSEFGEIITETFDITDDGITSIAITAGGGDDMVSLSRGVTLGSAINGGDGNDNLAGGAGVDNIDGVAGADRISGGLGADVLSGGAGNDTIYSADGVVDTVDGGDNDVADDGSAGDLAYVDGADTETADDVSNVEVVRASVARARFDRLFSQSRITASLFGGPGRGGHRR